MSLESLPFALMIVTGLMATFLFAAWALYAQMDRGRADSGWAVKAEGELPRRPRRQGRSS